MDLQGHVHSLQNLTHVMPVDLQYGPVTGTPFARQWFQRHDLVYCPVELHVVVVHNARQVSQPKLGGSHRPFPDHARLASPVAQQGIGLEIPAIEPCRQGQSHSNGYAMSQDA